MRGAAPAYNANDLDDFNDQVTSPLCMQAGMAVNGKEVQVLMHG